MSDIKPWQIILIIVALAVLAFSGWRMMGSGVVAGPDGHMTVDIMTGQLYMVQKGKARGIMYPVKHPETGDRTLFPVTQEDGSDTWELHGRSAGSISDKMRNESEVLRSGLRIDVMDSKPIVVVIKK